MSKEKSGQTSDADLVWKIGNKEKLLETPVFTVNKSVNTAPDGRSGAYITIDAPDWAAVIPEVDGCNGGTEASRLALNFQAALWIPASRPKPAPPANCWKKPAAARKA